MEYNVYDFGAVGDGLAKDTEAIQKAIDTCSAQGGGRVVLPKGVYLTGTLYMKSNVELHIEVSAILLGSGDINDYTDDTYKQLYINESHMDKCLIFSYNVENISFTGMGTIHGQGECFMEQPDSPIRTRRPMLMRYLNSRNIRLKDLRLRNPASWTTAFVGCSDIWVDGVDIESRVNWNGDGLDFNHCTNVFVSNCRLDCSDDCICLQNSHTEMKCKNIVVTNTIMKSKWAGIRIGLLSCGDIENVTVTNCIFRDIECSALKIQTAEEGTLKDMVFSNLVMENVQRPLFITLNDYRMCVNIPGKVEKTGRLMNMKFNNIIASGMRNNPNYLRSCMIIDGLPGCYIENITLSEIYYTAVGGGNKPDEERTEIPHHFGIQPECFNYEGPLPAFGLFARHVKGLKYRNLDIDTMLPDERPAIHEEDCV